ncbi:MAG: ECF transporter S component [Anaerolineae bacterium]|mgnify:CR=1 FL=1|nr:ECF transporter S component [Anaerolineae bacterium]
MKFDLSNPRTLAVTAVMTALTMALTMLVRVPTPVPNGYAHLADVAIYFAAFAFGPWVGLVAGGLGTALADVVGGYAQWAPITLIVHGLKGFVVGWIVLNNKSLERVVLAVLAGIAILVAGYLIGGTILLTFPVAVAEVIPNLFQGAVGILGVIVYFAVLRAYPRLNQLVSG